MQLPFGGRCEGRVRRVKKSPPYASPLPAHRERLSSLRPTFPLDHAPGGARPRLAALPGLGPSQLAPGGGRPGYFGLSHPASKSRQDAVFFGILPSTALAETPGSQGYVMDASKVPFLPGKPSLLALSKPEGISSMSWVPWEEPRVPVLPGCPHRSPAGHSSGDKQSVCKMGWTKIALACSPQQG